MTESKSTPLLTIRLEVRLTEEEQRQLIEMAKQHYPEHQRAQGLMIRRLIRQEYAKGKHQ